MAKPLRMAPSRLASASSGRFAADDRRSDKRADPFYLLAEWRALRDAIIQERGRRCEDPQCRTPRGPWKQIYGDHIVELADGGAPLDRANIMLRCERCHGRKTNETRATRAGWLDIAKTSGGASNL